MDQLRATTKEESVSQLYRTSVDSPIGKLVLVADEKGLRHLHFPDDSSAYEVDAIEDPERFVDATQQLDAYWAGKRVEFDLPLLPEGTAFRKQVWDALLEVPYGETASYGEVARRIGRPKAARAVGAACGSNPLPIFIPCHRVVGASGALTGFGGGLPIKERLLALEQAG